MGIANQQNMNRSIPVLPQPYGIRVRLRPGDPFAKLVGADWQKTHWFFTAAERDRVLEDMSRRHEYSRIGDRPALVFEKVEKLAESRNFCPDPRRCGPGTGRTPPYHADRSRTPGTRDPRKYRRQRTATHL